jgi:hypothetical protein
MNVFFHVLTGAAAAGIATRILAPTRSASKRYLAVCGALVVVGVLIHGLLDIAPHHYPFRAAQDIAISSGLIVVILASIRPRWIVLVGASIFGSVLPDLIDLGPTMLAEISGIDLRFTSRKIFFWHTPEFSGSIYDGSRALESHIYHAVVVLSAGYSIFATWNGLARKALASRLKCTDA